MATAPYVTVANACAEASRRLPHLPARIAPETLMFLRCDVSGPEFVSIANACGVSTLELVRCLGVVFADLRTFLAPVAAGRKA
jgi:hypothetical protein